MKGGPGTTDPGQITWTHVPMRTILVRAFRIHDYQLSAPRWVDSDSYDITAKLPPSTNEDRFGAMLRHFLEERFSLVSREEFPVAPQYALIVGKSGAKLKESTAQTLPDAPPPPQGVKFVDGFPALPPGPGMVAFALNGTIRLSAQAQSMAQLADLLAGRYLDRDVADQTGLKGVYDFRLSFTPESVLAHLPPGTDTLGTDLFTSLGEQLGLRLESRKGPVRTVYVDKLEKVPSAN